MTDLRVSQAGATAWVDAGPNVRVTQTGATLWIDSAPAVFRATAVGDIVWAVPNNPDFRATIVGAEVWLDVTTILAYVSGVSGTGGVGSLTVTNDWVVRPSGLETDLAFGTPSIDIDDTLTLTGQSATSARGSLTLSIINPSTGAAFFHSFP